MKKVRARLWREFRVWLLFLVLAPQVFYLVATLFGIQAISYEFCFSEARFYFWLVWLARLQLWLLRQFAREVKALRHSWSPVPSVRGSAIWRL